MVNLSKKRRSSLIKTEFYNSSFFLCPSRVRDLAPRGSFFSKKRRSSLIKTEFYNSSFFLPRGSFFSKKRRSGQFQIQQMAFMIVALFLFFVLVGLFALKISLKDITSSAQDLKTQKAIGFLSTLPSMTELSFSSSSCSNCLDKDKLRVFSTLSAEYKRFFPLNSLRAFKVYPAPPLNSQGELLCPSLDCIILFNSTKEGIQEYAIFVPVCEKSKRTGMLSESCEVWKLSGGVEFLE